MSFKTYVEEILQNEVLSVVRQQGYVLETEICTMVCEKYNLHLYIVRRSEEHTSELQSLSC